MKLALNFLGWTKFWYSLLWLACYVGGCGTVAHAAPPVKISQCYGTYCIVGSGCVIGRMSDGERIAILTCGHGWTPGYNVTIRLQPSLEITGKVVATVYNSELDIGVITAVYKPLTWAHEIGDDPPKGKEIEVCGFGSGNPKAWRTESKGPINKWAFTTDATFVQGDSGGPVIWGNRIAGVISGNLKSNGAHLPPTDGYATNASECKKFVLKTLGEMPKVKAKEEVAPPVDEPAPLPKKPDAPPPAENEYMKEISRLEKRIAELEKRKLEKGEAGKSGEDGQNATDAQVKSAVDKWLSVNEAKLKGKDGENGKPADESKLTALGSRITAIEEFELPIDIYKPDGTFKSGKKFKIFKKVPVQLQIESSESTRTVRE